MHYDDPVLNPKNDPRTVTAPKNSSDERTNLALPSLSRVADLDEQMILKEIRSEKGLELMQRILDPKNKEDWDKRRQFISDNQDIKAIKDVFSKIVSGDLKVVNLDTVGIVGTLYNAAWTTNTKRRLDPDSQKLLYAFTEKTYALLTQSLEEGKPPKGSEARAKIEDICKVYAWNNEHVLKPRSGSELNFFTEGILIYQALRLKAAIQTIDPSVIQK